MFRDLWLLPVWLTIAALFSLAAHAGQSADIAVHLHWLFGCALQFARPSALTRRAYAGLTLLLLACGALAVWQAKPDLAGMAFPIAPDLPVRAALAWTPSVVAFASGMLALWTLVMRFRTAGSASPAPAKTKPQRVQVQPGSARMHRPEQRAVVRRQRDLNELGGGD